jgi:hypothetical protein
MIFNCKGLPDIGMAMLLNVYLTIYITLYVFIFPMQLTLVSNVTNTSMFYVELRVRRGCYVRIARLIPTEFVIVHVPWTIN